MNLQVEPAALLELFEAAAWYDDARDGLGEEFIAAIEYAFELIKSAPRLSSSLEYWSSAWEVRRYCLQRFPYVVVYWIHGDSITIVAIAHGRRRPLYWIDRIRSST